MSIFKKIFRALKSVFKSIFDDVETWAGMEFDALAIEVEQKFPSIFESARDLIAIYESKDMDGGKKAVEVAKELIELAPPVLAALPQVKAFFVYLVTKIYASGQRELVKQVGGLVGKL